MPLSPPSTAHTEQDSHPTYKYITWLDLYPLPPLWPTPHLTARIDKVKQALESIKWKIEIRRQVVFLAESNGVYCSTCSPIRTTSRSCGVSCALQRPEAGSVFAAASERDPTWVRCAKMDLEGYDNMISDIDRLGYHASRRTVADWEAIVKNLLAGTKDSEPPTQTMRAVPGLDRDWTFDGRWGRGAGLKREFALEATDTPAAARNR